MTCTHPGYFKVSVSTEQQIIKQLSVDTVEQVQFLRDATLMFSGDRAVRDRLVTFETSAGCNACGILPERKTLKIKNGEVVLDLLPQAV